MPPLSLQGHNDRIKREDALKAGVKHLEFCGAVCAVSAGERRPTSSKNTHGETASWQRCVRGVRTLRVFVARYDQCQFGLSDIHETVTW